MEPASRDRDRIERRGFEEDFEKGREEGQLDSDDDHFSDIVKIRRRRLEESSLEGSGAEEIQPAGGRPRTGPHPDRPARRHSDHTTPPLSSALDTALLQRTMPDL